MIRSAHNYNAKQVSLDTMRDVSKPGPIVTVQDHSTDIKVIARQAYSTGMLPNVDLRPLTDFDVTDLDDYGDALRKIAAAENAFMKLPPNIRSKFDNDAKKAQAALSGMSPENIMELFNGEEKTSTPSPGAIAPTIPTGTGPTGSPQPGTASTGGTSPGAAGGTP